MTTSSTPTRHRSASDAEKTFDANEAKSPTFDHLDHAPNDPNNVHSQPFPQSDSARPRLDPERHPYLYAKKSRFSGISKRTKIIIGVITACVLILIIGLAAGLSSRNKTQNLPLPSDNGGPYQGDLTYYAPGLGACGLESKDGDNIVSISHFVYDAVSTSTNPNLNPLCGKMIRARRNDRSVDLKVVDRCTGCQPRDLDITEKTFAKLADVKQGRVDVTWSWLEEVPGDAD